MRKYFYITTILLLSACTPTAVSGLYRAQDCEDYSADCFQYNFHNDGNFVYWYTNSVFGDFYVDGNYYVIGKEVKLFPIKYIYHDTSSIIYTPRANNDSLKIKISLLPGYLKNRPDTMHVPWLIKTNNDKFFAETDEYGIYTTKSDSISKIMIKEYSAKYYFDGETMEADTVIKPKCTDCDIHIMLASSVLEPIVIPPVSKFKIKGKKLIAVQDSTSSTPYYTPKTNIYIK